MGLSNQPHLKTGLPAGASVAPVSAIADSRKTANATNRERERLFAIDFIGMGTELPPET
ncbi:hypothetical protein ACCUM_0312 [Candidatus Accumulibacter phosphatis]|uniref:Uncharacterized protein n=1 Tax=Candidatus Accumulibacter phosphatis TaxID=327160 RepID=A0A5S4EKP7_9PROT|nr:hypothetical protein ACCUM_0312 [Candidatus Accumulibacter phosphatis]